MNNTIRINNQAIADYVMFKLNKLDNEFNEEELLLIDELLINFNNDINDYLRDLSLFKNIKSLTFRNGFIYNDVFLVLRELEKLISITFDNCEFEEEKIVASLNLKELTLINCRINSYAFVYIMNHLDTLSIINGEVEIKKINLLTNLKHLEITNSNILDKEEIRINNLQELYIDNTNINNLDFLNNLIKLKKVSIDNHQYEENRKLVNELMKKGISFYEEAISPIVGDDRE